jgi:hypothetical protein
LVGLVLCSFIGSYAVSWRSIASLSGFSHRSKTNLTILSLQLLYTAFTQLIA